MVLYLDVLLALNLFVNYFLLLGTALLTKQNTRRLRIILGASMGSITSLSIFLPPQAVAISLTLKPLIAAVLVLITFGFHSLKVYLKNIGIFLGVNFIFAGVMMALWLTLSPNGMFYNHGIVYFDISPLVLIIGTVLAYLTIRIVHFIHNRTVGTTEMVEILIRVGTKSKKLPALIDTGNRLRDPFTGLPVAVCSLQSMEDLIPPELHSFFQSPSTGAYSAIACHPWRKRVKLIPYNTVGKEGMIASFEPDDFYQFKNGMKKKEILLIGVTAARLSDGEFQAILPEI